MAEKAYSTHKLIYDWNLLEELPKPRRPIMVSDESLRDGLQSPSITQPDIKDKVFLLYLMNDLGIEIADLGLCGAGERFKKDVVVLAREIVNQKMSIQPQSAARSIITDIKPIVDASEEAGIPIEAAIFLGTSPIRQYTEGWDLNFLIKQTQESVEYAVSNGLPVMFVTEDTTRADPETLKRVYLTAIEAGAQRICAADTVGHATPGGVRSLIHYLRNMVDEINPEVGIDWHGHRDRGLDISNSLVAIEAGADRIHACGLGIGERSGNTPMELLLVNLNLLGWADRDLTKLPDYCQLISDKFGAPISFNWPITGADAFRTSTGVHAAAIVKAIEMDDHWLTNCVYCGVPADMVGRKHSIEIGPMSGIHNVRYYLQQHNIEDKPIYLEKILAAAKRSSKLLNHDDILRMVAIMEARLDTGKDIQEEDISELLSFEN
ncbi:MAG: 2-isopropylmalate synthase [Chloroflexi bacterium]|nr:2-isopropylmalate synthase [Chloroflexota bacterium]